MQYFSPVHPRKLRIKPNQSVLLHSISYSDERRGGKKSADYKAKRKLTFLGQLTGSAAIRERVQALKHGSLDHLQFTVVCTGCGKKKGHKRNCAFHSSNLPNPPHSKTVSSPIPPIPSLPLSMTDPDVDSSCSSLDPLLSEFKKIAKHVFEKKIQKFLLDSPSVTNTRKTNTSRPVPYPSYIYQFPDPTLEDNFTNEMFSSAEMLQYYSFLSKFKCAAFLLGHDENGNWTSAITRLNSGESKLQACYRHYSMLQAALLLAAGERNSSIIT